MRPCGLSFPLSGIIWLPACAGICTVIFLFASCRGGDRDESGVFRYNESAGVSTLDPAFARELETMWVTNQIFDGLVELDENLQVVPSIAKRWEVSPDGLTYRFFLRDSVFFHPSPLFDQPEGRKVTAADFVWSFNRILDPEVASPGQWIFDRVDRTGGTGFYAENDSILVIQLSEPFPQFPGLLCTQYAGVVPREAVEHFGADFRSNPVGSGPFRFAFWYENIALVLHRSGSYWKKDSGGNALPYLDAVKIDFVKDMSVEFQGLLQGRYDFMSGIHPSYKDELLTPTGELAEAYSDLLVFRATPFVKTDYIGFVVDSSAAGGSVKALLDPLVRRALARAIPVREMVRYLRNNSVIPASGFVPPVLWSDRREASPDLTYNADSARVMLAKAGYPDGAGIPEITLAATPDYTDLLEFIQHQWQKIGVPTRVQVMQTGAFREATAKAQVNAFRKSWLADYADPGNFLGTFLTSGFSPAGPNYTHYSDGQFDLLYASASGEADDSLRNGMYRELEAFILRDMPVIPLFHDQVSHFLRKDISGFVTNGVNMIDLTAVRKKAGPDRSP
jgi:oligopeptide transport system substrate-binding protein